MNNKINDDLDHKINKLYKKILLREVDYYHGKRITLRARNNLRL